MESKEPAESIVSSSGPENLELEGMIHRVHSTKPAAKGLHAKASTLNPKSYEP